MAPPWPVVGARALLRVIGRWIGVAWAEKLHGRICSCSQLQMGIDLPLGILATPPVGGLDRTGRGARSPSLADLLGLLAWGCCCRALLSCQQICTEKVLPGSMRAVGSQRV